MLRVTEQAYRTDTGRQRTANEDAYYARAPVFVVADGMGGAQAGEVASKMATDAFDRDLGSTPPERALRELAEGANRRIHEHAQQDASRAGMGTTLTAAIVNADDHSVAIGHVGDSRAYLLRGAKLEQLTQDHSLVEEQGPAHRRAGVRASPALDHHARARSRGGRGRRHPHRAGPSGRRIPALLGRAHDDARRGADRAHPPRRNQP